MSNNGRITKLSPTFQKPLKAFLVGFYSSNQDIKICEEHLEELSLLAKTCGLEVLKQYPLYLREPNVATYISKGKLEELSDLVSVTDADILVLDEEVTPSQERNLEKVFGKTVVGRTEIILDVFAQRAHTKEAQLQVETALVRYQMPRLKRLWSHLHRQRGGGVYLKGEGEKQIEIDRRLLKDRLSKLERDLSEVEKYRETQRKARQKAEIPTFAIVGYTNAGKSTLLKTLTEAEVLVEDKLFATLDTTTRCYTLPNKQGILLIDTVGFIRKLPHSLVAAFKSTLEESLYADILLHIVDISNPMAEEQAAACYEVLHELKAQDKPIITVLNKVDQCQDQSLITRMRLKYPHTVIISALKETGFDQLFSAMTDEISRQRRTVKARISQSKYHLVSEILRQGSVINQEYEDNDIIIEAQLPFYLLEKIQDFIIEG